MSVRLPCASNPAASVIIVAHCRAGALETCLRALAHGGLDGVPAEVLIVANAPSAGVVSLLRERVTGARVITSSVNLSFAIANNRAARLARGRYLVFLNDDTVPAQGWLMGLVRAAELHPRAGAIGSRILFPDGRLQEAGSIIWADGSTVSVGRGLPAGNGAFGEARETDYCSACSLLVRRDTWNEVGGFSPEYFPAYYEDTDLALKIRTSGQFVLYAPASSVVHHESLSNADPLFKDFVFHRSKAVFRRTWAHVLGEQERARPMVPAAVRRAIRRARRSRPHVLLIDDRMPTARLGSGLPRMRDAVRELAREFWLSLAATDGPTETDDELAGLGVETIAAPIDQALAAPERLFDAVVVSRPHNYDRLAPVVRRHQPQAVLVYDAEALFHVRDERQARRMRGGVTREAIERRAAAMQRVEADIARTADVVVSLAAAEAQFFRDRGATRVVLVPPILDGIAPTGAPLAHRRDIGFVAGWLAGPDAPNVADARWLVEDVMPRVWRRLPSVRVRVTGERPPAAVRRLAGPAVHLVGHQSDLGRFYDGIRVAVAPVQFGAGVKNKSIEAVQFAVPLVATPDGAEGLEGAEPGAVARCDTAEAFADALVALLSDDEEWTRARRACEHTARRWRRARRRRPWVSALRQALLDRDPAAVGRWANPLRTARPGSPAR